MPMEVYRSSPAFPLLMDRFSDQVCSLPALHYYFQTSIQLVIHILSNHLGSDQRGLGRVVKATDLKSVGIFPRRFGSTLQKMPFLNCVTVTQNICIDMRVYGTRTRTRNKNSDYTRMFIAKATQTGIT